jgi:hypothetical protein
VKVLVFAFKALAFILKWVVKGIILLIKGIAWLFKWLARAWRATVRGMMWLVRALGIAWDAMVRAAVWVTRKLGQAWNAIIRAAVWVVNGLKWIWGGIKKIAIIAAEETASAWVKGAEMADRAWNALKKTFKELARDAVPFIKREMKSIWRRAEAGALVFMGRTKEAKKIMVEGGELQRSGFRKTTRVRGIRRPRPATTTTTNNNQLSVTVNARTGATAAEISRMTRAELQKLVNKAYTARAPVVGTGTP